MIEGGGVVRRRIYPMADEFKQRRDIDGDFFFPFGVQKKKKARRTSLFTHASLTRGRRGEGWTKEPQTPADT